jgi:acetylornithine deacetylase/succinyl-diaminopimelate desuccinylase-like protein
VVISDVNPDTVRSYIEALTNFGTHSYTSKNRYDVSRWIQATFLRMGFSDAVLDTFSANGYLQYNVVATLPSSTAAEDVIVIGGHHDTVGGGSIRHLPRGR